MSEAAAPLSDVDPGEVVLRVQPSGARVVDALPTSAFENLLVLETNADLRRIERTVRERGGDPSHVGVVPIAATELTYDGPLWTTERANPGDLTGVSIRFSEAFAHVRPDDGWVVFDSLSVLAMYVAPERLLRFVDAVVTAVRERNARCVLAVTRGVLGERTRAQIADRCDRAIGDDA